jgi:hypothetical protein
MHWREIGRDLKKGIKVGKSGDKGSGSCCSGRGKGWMCIYSWRKDRRELSLRLRLRNWLLMDVVGLLSGDRNG